MSTKPPTSLAAALKLDEAAQPNCLGTTTEYALLLSLSFHMINFVGYYSTDEPSKNKPEHPRYHTWIGPLLGQPTL